MAIGAEPVSSHAGAGDTLDLSATGSRLVYRVAPYQALSIQAVNVTGSPPSPDMGSTVITLYRSNDGATAAALATATTLATGNGWMASVDKSADPFEFLIVETTTGHGSAGKRARIIVNGSGVHG